MILVINTNNNEGDIPPKPIQLLKAPVLIEAGDRHVRGET